MKFTSSIKPLLEAVGHAVLALPPKATDFRFESITMTLDKKRLTLFATDGDIALQTSIEADSGEKGVVSLQAKKFLDILRNMYETVAEFKTDKKDGDNEVSFSIKTDRGTYRIAGSSQKPEQMAAAPEFDLTITMPASELKALAEKTLFAASTDDMRPAMMGVLLEIESKQLRAVATDGHRLVRFTKKMETGAKEKLKIIVPARVVNIVQKSLGGDGNVEIAISSKEQRIQFTVGETTIIAGLIAENYPNYEAVIPLENDKKMLVNRSNMAGTIKRVARFSSRGDVRLAITKDALQVSAENTDEGSAAEESVPCEFQSDSITIGFNSKFVEDALGHLDSDEVDFEFSTPTRATIIRPKDSSSSSPDKKGDDLLMLVMPVRINS
ncbi:MAG: DNA polymerase III subunit beta [Rhizobacter sp.]|nr:DNA polymerase III subunit beta [Chlorobiales bacterium]